MEGMCFSRVVEIRPGVFAQESCGLEQQMEMVLWYDAEMSHRAEWPKNGVGSVRTVVGSDSRFVGSVCPGIVGVQGCSRDTG